jgi:hypothetical protein
LLQNFVKRFFFPGRIVVTYRLVAMQSENPVNSELKTRAIYGGIVGAILGMIIGTMPGNEPLVGILSMGLGAVVIGGLAVLSKNFWESLCAAWELLRVSFWRW